MRADAKEIVALIRPAMRNAEYVHKLQAACVAAAPPLMHVPDDAQAVGSSRIDPWTVRLTNYASVIKQWGLAATRVEVAIPPPLVRAH